MALWEEATDEEGRVYYYNTETHETSWEKPVEAQSSDLETALKDSKWEQYSTEEGEVYYYNVETQQSSWEIPEEIKARLLGGKHEDTDMQAQEEMAIDDIEDIEELVQRYPNSSEISATRQPNTITPKQSAAAKSEFIEMLESGSVDNSWSFTKVMEAFIRDPRYWRVPDALMRKELFESYLINNSEEEYKKSMNAKELFRTNFIKVLQNYDIRYFTRWKTISNQIVDEPIYSLASEKLKKEIFQEYVQGLRAEHEKEQLELRKQALSELESYFRDGVKLSLSSTFEELLQSIETDKRYKDNKHFTVLTKLDILSVYNTVIRQLELEVTQLVKYHKRRNYSNDRLARQAFLQFLRDSNIKVTPRTTWLQFSTRIKDSPQFQNLVGRAGSSPIDYFWDLLDESQQYLDAQKNLLSSRFVELGVLPNEYDNFDAFTELLQRHGLPESGDLLSKEELEIIYEKFQSDAKKPESDNNGRQRELSPVRRATPSADQYRTNRDSSSVGPSTATTTTTTAPAVTAKIGGPAETGELDY